MTDEEKLKADNKVSTLTMSERTLIINGFTREMTDSYFLFED